MAKRHYSQGGDAKAIKKVADKHFDGDYAIMFERHGWLERGSDMMRKVQTRVVERYGSIQNFEVHFEVESEPMPDSSAEPFNDMPIMESKDDRFGFDDFTKAIADGIVKIKNPFGSVIAI